MDAFKIIEFVVVDSKIWDEYSHFKCFRFCL